MEQERKLYVHVMRKVREDIILDMPGWFTPSQEVFDFLDKLLVGVKDPKGNLMFFKEMAWSSKLREEKFPLNISLPTSTVKHGEKDHEWSYLNTEFVVRSQDELYLLDVLISVYSKVVGCFLEARKSFGRASWPGKHSFAIWNLRRFQEGLSPEKVSGNQKVDLVRAYHISKNLGI